MKHILSNINGIRFQRSVLICAVLFLTATGAQAQDIRELITPDSPIPKGSYKSWSLFLISNPEWVLPENNDRLRVLYERFRAFGGAIGPEHLAVWFWSRDPRSDKLYKSVDVVRSAAYCTKLKLPPGKGPYVLVTTNYPGEGMLGSYPKSFPDDLKDSYLIEFDGADASEIMKVLKELGDKLISEGLAKLDPKSEGFWRSLQRSSEALSDILVGFSKKIRVTIKTTFFDVEIKP